MMARPLDRDILLTSVMPHMHWLGKDFTFTAVLPDGKTRIPLIKIDHWNFNWQGTYAFKEPIRMPKGSWFEVEAHFDNSDTNPANQNKPPKVVRWGEGTNDEMCIGIFEWVVDRGSTGAGAQARRRLRPPSYGGQGPRAAAVHLRRGLLPTAHDFPQGHVAQKVAQVGVRPQTGNNLGWLTQLGEKARDQALGLGPQGLGFASGLMSQRRRLGVPYPDRAVAGTGRQARAVGAEGEREHVVRVSLEARHLLAASPGPTARWTGRGRLTPAACRPDGTPPRRPRRCARSDGRRISTWRHPKCGPCDPRSRRPAVAHRR